MQRTTIALLAALGTALAWMTCPSESPPPPPLPTSVPCQRGAPGGAGGASSVCLQLARSEVVADGLRRPCREPEPTLAEPSREPPGEPVVALDGKVRGELVVLDDDTGEPIVGYGVRCTPHADARPAESGAAFDALGFALRTHSTHRAGTAELRGLRPGRNLLLVEPDDRVTFAPMAPVEFDVCETFAARQVVRLPRAGQRTLVVVRRDGTPVAGTVVELLLPCRPGAAAELTFETLALSPRQCFERGVLPPAMMVQRVVTDADGCARLRGARNPWHGLRLLGPGHMPARVPALRLDDSQLRVEVDVGATLRGRVDPRAELEPIPGLQAERLARYRPGLQLVDVDDAERRVPARRRDSLPLAADGSFRIDGIAPGSWDVLLTRWVFASDGGETMTTESIARVLNLSAGEERVLELRVAVPR